jgi:ATP synthase protein I
MNEPERSSEHGVAREDEDERFRASVASKEARKLRARRGPDRTPWSWLGVFGIVGWSITVPTLLGVAIGAWIDHRSEDAISWTLTLMGAGLGVGCLTAWYWVRRESEGGSG